MKKLLYIPLDYQRHESDDTLFGDLLRAFEKKFEARIFTTMSDAIEFNPEIVFFQGSLVPEDLLGLKRKTGAKIVMWTGDCRYAPTNSLMDYRFVVDQYLLPFKGDLLFDYKHFLKKPCNYIFEPIQNWRFKEPKELKGGRVVFVGNHYGNFEGGESRTELIKYLNIHLKDGIDVYGNIGGSRGERNYKDVPDIYNSAYIVICENNIHDVEGYFTPRNIGAMAAGSLPLMRFFNGADKIFCHLFDSLLYRTKYEMLDYIMLLKNNPEIRNSIARAAHIRATLNFSVDSFVDEFIKTQK